MNKSWPASGRLRRRLISVILIILLGVVLGFSARPLLVEYHLWQARLDIQNGAHLQASLHLAQAAGLNLGQAGLWEQAGDEALLGSSSAQAIQYLEHAAAQGALSPAGQVKLGDALQAAGDLQAAIHAWQSAPASAEAWLRLAKAHETQKDYPAEIIDLKALLALQPGQAQTAYRLGLLEAAFDPASAPAYLSQAASLDPSLTAASRAIQVSLDTASLQSEPAYTHLLVGRALASLGEWDLAAESFYLATQMRTDYAEAWAYLGEARQHAAPVQSDDQTGLAELQKAWDLDPSSISANTFLGFYWQRHAKPDLALVYLKKAASLDPQNPVLQTELGNAVSTLGDLPTAQEYYQHAIDLDPQNPVYWRIMAEFSLMHQIQVRQIALPAARQAVLLDPQDSIGLDLLGQAFFMLEDYDNAARTLQRALQANPAYPPAHLHMGQTLLMQGDLDNGRQELNQTISLSPDSAYADQARRLLQRYFP
jgi:tetratricopeptide (TPR) repeat protein